MVKVVPTISARINNAFDEVKETKAKLKIATPKKPSESWIVRCFKEFAANTALHGYNHIVREDTSKWERRAWSAIVIIATIVSIVLLWVSWHWNSETPTVTVIESTHYPIWNVPFPAVTICGMNKISAKAAMQLATNMTRPEGMPPAELSKMFSLSWHFQGIGNATKADYDQLHSILQMNKMTVLQLTSSLTPKCSEMLERCTWKSIEKRCENIFQPINTTEGICCSFNYYGLAKNNFPTKIAERTYELPRRATACGFQTGLTVIVNPMTADYHSSFFSSYGYRVFIHDPFDFTDDNAETKAISSKMLAFISVNPESTYSTPEVRRLPPSERNCYFENEFELNYMQRYSYTNCLAECRSQVIHKLCGCVPFHMPNNGSYRICEMNDLSCVLQHKNAYSGALPGLNRTVMRLSEATIANTPCDCLPDCQLNQYPSEVTSAYLNRTFAYSFMSLYKGVNISDHSTITVYFADLVSTHYRKDVYQNWLSLLASFGGLLGLLLGFSFVTGFELIYFFTIRVFFDHLANKKK